MAESVHSKPLGYAIRTPSVLSVEARVCRMGTPMAVSDLTGGHTTI